MVTAYRWLCQKSHFGFRASASPPDVTYRLEIQAPILKLHSIHSGFAAGCDIPSRIQAPILKRDSIHSGFAAGCDIPSRNLSADPAT
jgi:hypothetical protein